MKPFKYRNILTKKFLHKEYIANEKTIIQIAKEIGCSFGSIQNYLLKNNIPIRTISQSLKGKYSGRMNWNYLDGRTLKQYYCRDCKTKISFRTALYGQGMCNSCANKGKNSYFFKDGRSLKAHFCADCNKEICLNNGLYGNGRCYSCAKKGILNFAYIAGLDREYPNIFNNLLKEQIRYRDSYICQLCDKTQERELKELHKQLPIHHIDYDKTNCKEENLITLCCKCNAKVNFNRDYWYAYFIYIMEEKNAN